MAGLSDFIRFLSRAVIPVPGSTSYITAPTRCTVTKMSFVCKGGVTAVAETSRQVLHNRTTLKDFRQGEVA